MPYNEGINWPASIDQFPSLRDSVSPSISEDQILFAQHYNKIGNFINKAQIKWTNTTAASGDGTIQSIFYPSDPSVMGFSVPLPVVARISCPWAYDYRSDLPSGFPTKNIPGNVLPFEFVLTRDISYGLPWSYQSYRMAYQTTSPSGINNYLNGAVFNNYVRFQVSLWNSASVQSYDAPIVHSPNQNFIVNSWGLMGSQTFIIRGTVTDLSGNTTSDLELWDLYPTWHLVCTYQGVRDG